ncbi:MAG: hypothetical protein ACTSRX_05870 [Promethearchaeota archaeon]
MVSTSDISKFFEPIVPYINWIILIFTPIYIAIGAFFANIALAFISILPSDSLVLSIIVMIIFIGLGILFGIKPDILAGIFKKKSEN